MSRRTRARSRERQQERVPLLTYRGMFCYDYMGDMPSGPQHGGNMAILH
jgi:hypothetical protein